MSSPDHPGPETENRGPGRPRQGERGEDVRARLLAAAIELVTRRGFAEVGLREVAAAARVTPAMVSYYFGDKQGLYEAMLESVFQRLVERVATLAPHESGGDADRLAAFVRMHIGTLAEEPWAPQLILREVLGREGPLRERFVGRFASRMAAAVRGLIEEEIAAGRLRGDLDPRLALLSLMGLCVFPYLSHPISGRVLGFELDDDFRDRLTEHTLRLLAQGLRPRESGA